MDMKNLFAIIISFVIVAGVSSSCKKEILLPTVTTKDATNVEYQTATLNGEVTDNGGGTISERGFYYSTTQDFTPGGTGVTQVKNGSGDGTFSADISGLSPMTTYYYQAYATNETGTTYAIVKTFKTK
jgi:hypothetical protein